MLEMVHGTNFRSYADVKLEFGNRQVSVVFGDSQSDYADSNGTGKTSLMYLVLWTLFGKWPGMESADSCVRQPHNKDCSGVVWIRKADGRYAISRYRNHSIHGNNVFIQPPNNSGAATTAPEKISGDLKIMNERIEGLLGMNYDTFVRTMVFTGTEGTTFALMTDKEQKTLLDTIVPFDFSALHQRAKEKQKFAAETEIECNGVTKAIDAWLAKNADMAFALNEKRRKLIEENNEATIREKISTLDKHCAAYSKGVHDTYEQKKELLPKREEAYKAVTDYRPVVRQFEEAKERWTNFNAATEMLRRMEDERRRAIEGVDRDIENGKRRLATDQAGGVCHTCGQTLGPEAMQKAVSSTQADLNDLGAKRMEIIRHYDHLQQSYIKKQTESGLNDETAAKFLADYRAANEHLRKLDTAYDDLTRQELVLDQRISSYQDQLKKANQVRQELTAALVPSNGGMSEIDVQLEELARESARLKEDRKASTNNQQEWAAERALWDNVATMLGGGKGSLQHFLFEALLPEMTAIAQMCLSLFSKDQLRVAFKSHKKKGSKTVEGFYIEASKGAQTQGYGNLSGGERRRIDFCIFLTLHLMAAKHLYAPGVLFLDEIADFMDDTGQQAVVSVLEFFCQQYGVSCLLLTNKRELVASVAHGYRCAMTDGISSLVSVQET